MDKFLQELEKLEKQVNEGNYLILLQYICTFSPGGAYCNVVNRLQNKHVVL
jgi:hypothetical protein